MLASKGEAPKQRTNYVVPDGILGSHANDAKQHLKDHGVNVIEINIDSPRPKDTVVDIGPGRRAPGRSTGTSVIGTNGRCGHSNTCPKRPTPPRRLGDSCGR